MSAPDFQVVRFVTPWRVYNGGETAGFPPKEAQWLIDNGIAVKVVPEPAAAVDEGQGDGDTVPDATPPADGDTVPDATPPAKPAGKRGGAPAGA